MQQMWQNRHLGYQCKSCIYCQASASLISKHFLKKKLVYVVKVTKLINQYYKNHDIEISSITEEYLNKNPQLVRTMAVQPPRGSGNIRMISIGENVDYQPCGGTHVKNTSEINLIKKLK